MSWEQYLAILVQNQEDRRNFESDPPVACPNDGQPLEGGPDGQLHCRFDGWVWDGQPIR